MTGHPGASDVLAGSAAAFFSATGDEAEQELQQSTEINIFQRTHCNLLLLNT